MKRDLEINKVLVPIDFSGTASKAIEHAANLCLKFGAELQLLHVFTPMSNDVFPMLDYNIEMANIKESAMNHLKKVADEFSEKFGVTVNLEVRDGSPTKEICTAANDLGADMIVMGTHGVSGFEEFFLGSNAYRVVTASTVPVLTVQETADKYGYQNISLPIDSSQHTRDKVANACHLAKAFGATVHIAAMITEEHEDEKNIFNLKVKQIEEYLEEEGVDYLTTTRHGDNIAKMTMAHADEVDADLVIIMTEQEASTGLFVGPYAQQIVNHCKKPVLSITPIEVVSSFGQDQLAGDYRPFYI